MSKDYRVYIAWKLYWQQISSNINHTTSDLTHSCTIIGEPELGTSRCYRASARDTDEAIIEDNYTYNRMDGINLYERVKINRDGRNGVSSDYVLLLFERIAKLNSHHIWVEYHTTRKARLNRAMLKLEQI